MISVHATSLTPTPTRRPRRLVAALVAVAAVGMITACGGPEEVAPATPTSSAPIGQDSAPVVIASVDGQTPAAVNPGEVQSPPPTSRADDADTIQAGTGGGLCLDPDSELAQSSIDALNPDPNGGHWEVWRASRNAVTAGCGLDWILVNGSGYGDGTYTSRVLLFESGHYLGTVEPSPHSYTTVSASTSTSVAVTYRWLRTDDPFCCPQGGPSTVTATLVDGAVVRQGSFPPA